MKIIQKQSVTRDYGFDGILAIIYHPSHGRLLLEDGYGGEDQIRGGMVRWEHGRVIKLLPDDDFDSLNEDHNDHMTILHASLNGYRDERPILDWTGHMIDKVAVSLGL